VVPEFTFELLEKDACKGVIRSALYQGPWLIVDNGYLKWSTTVPPLKLTKFGRGKKVEPMAGVVTKGCSVHFRHTKRTVAYIKDWYSVGMRRGGRQYLQNMLCSP